MGAAGRAVDRPLPRRQQAPGQDGAAAGGGRTPEYLRKDRIAVAPKAEALPVLHRQILLRLVALPRHEVARAVETGELCRVRARASHVGFSTLPLSRTPAAADAEGEDDGDGRVRAWKELSEGQWAVDPASGG